MILLVDNNDSFSYNVLQMLHKVTSQRVVVERSSDLNVDAVEGFDYVIFSPGPGLPSDFGAMREILRRYDQKKAILGICLGHQAICEYYGGRLVNLGEVAHGVKSEIWCDCRSKLFAGIDKMTVGRYHSWVADQIAPELRVVASLDNEVVMAVEHKHKRVYSVQFHPESYITKNGEQIFKNFLNELP